MTKRAITILSLCLALLGGGQALAQTASKISDFNDWATYGYQAQGGRVCYVLTVPTEKQPSSLDHGNIFFLVSQKPGQNVQYEPQFIAGYSLRENSKVTVTVGDQSFSMFTQGNSAWMENAAQEPQLIAAMRTGSSMKLQATSGRGNETNYVFSLRGITAALDSIQSCK